MSVVYLRRDGDLITMVSDGILLFGDEIRSAEKLKRLKNCCIVGFCGYYRINDFICQELEKYDYEVIYKWKLRDWYDKLNSIIKDFYKVRALKESDISDDFDMIIVVKNKIYTISPTNNDQCLSIQDCSTSKEVSIGIDEYLLGAVWNGCEPVQALAKIIPHHAGLGWPIKQVLYNIEHKTYEERNYQEKYFKYVDC